MVVEDDQDFTTVLSSQLAHCGFEVATADTIAVAHDLLPTQCWDVAVIDVMLPDGDGRDLIPELRLLRPAPRVILTSVLSRYDLAGHTADAFLPKPSRRADLVAALTWQVGTAPDHHHGDDHGDDHVTTTVTTKASPVAEPVV